jgi:hypothetical protein
VAGPDMTHRFREQQCQSRIRAADSPLLLAQRGRSWRRLVTLVGSGGVGKARVALAGGRCDPAVFS